jgi:hypothetical protein
MRILSLDPGGTTGYSWCELDGDKSKKFEVHGGQLGPSKHHLPLWQLLMNRRAKWNWDVVVCETFSYRMVALEDEGGGTSYSPNINLISKEYIGVVELWAKSSVGSQALIVWQQPSEAVGKKPFWHDDRLKLVGLHNKGERHRNDATRHLLHYTVTKLGYKAYLLALR